MIRAALFDLDGVIVDTAKYHYQAWRRLAAELGFEFTEADNERLKGVSRMASLEILLSVGGPAFAHRFSLCEKEELAARKNGWYVGYISRMSPREILPGALEFLYAVHADGIKCALGSASKNTGIILSRLEIGNLFDAVVDGTMVAHSKPDPEVFLKCAQQLSEHVSLTGKDCVVFEDAAAGIQAAHAGGMLAVGVGSEQVLRDADLVITGFAGVEWRTIKDKLNTLS